MMSLPALSLTCCFWYSHTSPSLSYDIYVMKSAALTKGQEAELKVAELKMRVRICVESEETAQD